MREDIDAIRTPIRGTDLRPYILAPAAGAIPTVYFFVPGYRGTVVWNKGALPVTQAFEAEAEYTARVRLRAAVGYTFAGVPAAPEEGSFSHSRSETISHAAGSDGTLVITISFAPAGSSY